jgi:hypothetical protein
MDKITLPNTGKRFNPKALKLNGLETFHKKVTVGFKCHPKLKLHLANEANKAGLTLSELVEVLLHGLTTATELEKDELDTLKRRIAFYENEKLLRWYKLYKGQHVPYVNEQGQTVQIFIKEPQDIYTVLINSFKLKK